MQDDKYGETPIESLSQDYLVLEGSVKPRTIMALTGLIGTSRISQTNASMNSLNPLCVDGKISHPSLICMVTIFGKLIKFSFV